MCIIGIMFTSSHITHQHSSQVLHDPLNITHFLIQQKKKLLVLLWMYQALYIYIYIYCVSMYKYLVINILNTYLVFDTVFAFKVFLRIIVEFDI